MPQGSLSIRTCRNGYFQGVSAAALPVGIAATINREERTRSSAYTTTETVLAAFADPGVLSTTTSTPVNDPATNALPAPSGVVTSLATAERVYPVGGLGLGRSLMAIEAGKRGRRCR